MPKNKLKKKLISIALSALTALSSGTVAMTTALITASPVVYASGELTNQDKKLLKAEEKMILTVAKDALKPFCPWIGYVTESIDMFLGLTGFLDGGGGEGGGISKEDLENLRSEINEQLTDIKKQIAATGEYVTEEFNNTLISNSFGKGLDTLHASVDTIARQIESTKRNKNLTENEKLVEIASKIGSSSEWAKSTDNIVNQMAVTRSMLKGTTFSDLNGRDIYEVLYDHYKTKCLFSSEVYDKETPYIQRAVCEYYYDYSVMLECMEAALKVSRFTAEEIDALSAKQKNMYYSVVSLDTVIEDEMIAQTLEMFNIHSDESVLSRYLTYMYNDRNSRYTYINKGNVMQPVKSELGSYAPGLEPAVGEIKVNDTNGSDSTAAHNAYNNSASSRYKNAVKNNYYVPAARINEMSGYIKSAYPGKFNSIQDYLSDRGFTYTLSGSNTNMLVTSESLTEREGYNSRNDTSGEYDFWKTKGYNGFNLSKQSLDPERFSLYYFRHRKVRDTWAYNFVAYEHYYSFGPTDENRNSPVKLYFFEKDELKNNTTFAVKKDAETGKLMLHVDCSSTGATGSVKCTIMYRKDGDRFWTNSYVPYATFDISEYSEYEFMTLITDSAGNKKESEIFDMRNAERNVPYIDADGSEKTVLAKPISADMTTLEAGWYAVTRDLTINKRIECKGDVHIILCDGCKLTLNEGIAVNDFASYDRATSLTIYGQKNGTGALEAHCDPNKGAAAIGSKAYGFSGMITINGGRITAYGKADGAGIGGGYKGNGYVTINGGIVTAEQGENSAAIGGGNMGIGTVIVKGGVVKAVGRIGAGFDNDYDSDIRLSWKNETDSITAESYNGRVTLKKLFNDGENNYEPGVVSNSAVLNGKTLVPGQLNIVIVAAEEPYINDNGEYILGTKGHYLVNGKSYAINSDGSRGGELTDVSLSYFDFELLWNDNYQINAFTGSYDSISESGLVIPKTFNGKKVTTLGKTQRFMNATGAEKPFTLVLNENITRINSNAFASSSLTKVTGDTSSLSEIGGSSVFAYVNKNGGHTLDIQLDSPKFISCGYNAFRDVYVTFRIKHNVNLLAGSNGAKRINYIFTDAHTYGEPEWKWADDFSSATLTMTCTDDRCGHTQTINAVITKAEDNTKITYTAEAELDGEKYTNTKEQIKPHVHTYGEPEWTWADDFSSAKAAFTCTGCEETETIDAAVEITEDAGKITYTATAMFGENTYTATKEMLYVPQSEPYINEYGEYIPGNVSHYISEGKKYAVKPDGSIGGILNDVTVSYFAFELLDTDEYRINYYTGSYEAMTDQKLIIPKLYNGKKVTSLGTSDYSSFMRATGTQNSFTLVLNENIKTIKSHAFDSSWVSEVSGDTSALCEIEKQAFSYSNNKGWHQFNIKFDYPGEINIGESAFARLSVYARLRHETTLSSAGNANNFRYIFTDDHIYGDPEWKWADDYSTATATFICSDERCRHEETVKATVKLNTDSGKKVYVASATLNGATYTDMVVVVDAIVNTSKVFVKQIGKTANVTVNCSSEGGYGDFVYSVYYRKTPEENTAPAASAPSADEWTTVQEKSTNKAVSIILDKEGSYDVRVEAFDVESSAVKDFKVTVEHVHTFGDPVWTWSDDFSSAKAEFTCTGCDHTETVDAAVVKTEDTYKITYTAVVEFGENSYTETKEIDQSPVYYPAAEPYIDDNGAYILGYVEHYEHKGKYYAVNADKSVGEEITDIWISYFEFELLSDDAYAIKWYKGPNKNLTEIVIPKTFKDKKITVLGTDNLDLFIKKGKPQFVLVLNENITEIKSSAFNTVGVTKVTGDTSNLSKIGAYAFSWANKSGGNTLDITLTYPGEITVGDAIFNQTKVTLNICHATTFSNTEFRAKSVNIEFTDGHTYGEPEWVYGDDYFDVKAVFSCTNPYCDHTKEESATFSSEYGDGYLEPIPIVEFEGKIYYDNKPAYQTEADDYTIEVYGRYRGILYAPASKIESSGGFRVVFMDKDGSIIDPPQYIWVAKETAEDGIVLEPDGNVRFTKIGEFHVQIRSADGKTEYSPWITIRSFNGAGYGPDDDDEPSAVVIPVSDIPKTGDATSAGTAAVILLGSLTAALFLAKKRRRNEDE